MPSRLHALGGAPDALDTPAPSSFVQKQRQVANTVHTILSSTHRSYQVREDDTFESIAEQIGVGSEQLRASLILGVRALVGKVLERV